MDRGRGGSAQTAEPGRLERAGPMAPPRILGARIFGGLHRWPLSFRGGRVVSPLRRARVIYLHPSGFAARFYRAKINGCAFLGFCGLCATGRAQCARRGRSLGAPGVAGSGSGRLVSRQTAPCPMPPPSSGAEVFVKALGSRKRHAVTLRSAAPLAPFRRGGGSLRPKESIR